MAASAVVLALVGAAGSTTSVFAGASREPEGSSLEAWGEGTRGQLGNGIGVNSSTPVPVSGVTCAVAAAVNETDSLAILGNGTVEGWGVDEGNEHGFLGDNGSDTVAVKPVPIDEAGITTAVGVTADNDDVYVLLANGTIIGWGSNRSGQFGNGSGPSEGSNTPVAIATSLSAVSALAASDQGATLALLSDGEVDSWSEAAGNALGREGSGGTPGPVDIAAKTPLIGARAVSEGANFSLALVGGAVKAWGEGTNGQLGNGKTEASKLPVTVGGPTPLEDVSEIAAGSNFTLALVNGKVKAWGDGARGQLGNGEEQESNSLPVAVANLTDIVAIAATEEDGYALDSSGRVWAWGSNKQGELGTGISASTDDEPVEIVDLGSGNAGLAGGVDGTHEISLGAKDSTGCVAPSKTETTTSNPGNGTSSTPTQTSSTPTTSTTPSPTPGAAAAKLVLKCTASKLTLTDVVQQNGHVLLDGAAESNLAGHKVKILFDATKLVATATVAADGLFSASAPLPPPKLRGSNSSRYLAESGSLKSLDLKLTRRLILDPPKSAAGKVSLSGQVQPPLAKPPATVLVQQQLSCGATKTVAHFKPRASGHFTVSVPVPVGATAAIYRLSTKVRGNTTSAKLFPTDSLPEPVGLSL